MIKSTALKFMGIVVFLFSLSVHADVIEVNCSQGHELQAAVGQASENTTIKVTGTCNGPVEITKNGIKLFGGDGSSKAIIQKPNYIPFPVNLLVIDGATRVEVSGFELRNGLSGVDGKGNASFTLDSVNIIDNIMGINLSSATAALHDVVITDNGVRVAAVGLNAVDRASVIVSGTVEISNILAFAINLLSNSSLKIDKNGTLNSHHNLMGGQISVNSSFFVDEGASANFYDNQLIGFSINTGSTGMLFNSNLTTRNNGLDGLDVVSAANFEVDGMSQIISENNGREGISVDNSTINLFGFFSTAPGFPKITSNNNGSNGFQIEASSKLDIGRNSSIIALNNGKAGVSLDDGSSAFLQSSDINNNQTSATNENVTADLIATFGSRVTFSNANNIGLAACDVSSISRGDVICKKGNVFGE